jgi:hypothetical protein
MSLTDKDRERLKELSSKRTPMPAMDMFSERAGIIACAMIVGVNQKRVGELHKKIRELSLQENFSGSEWLAACAYSIADVLGFAEEAMKDEELMDKVPSFLYENKETNA